MLTPVPPAHGVRLSWEQVPDPVRASIEAEIGGRVAAAETQPSGFSPGLAARITLTDGRRVFVKAVSGAQNRDSPGLHRAEARITSVLPPDAPVPRLLGVHDDGDWVALIYEDIDGRHPTLPWCTDELAGVLDAVTGLHEALTPCPVPDARAVQNEPGLFCGWRSLYDRTPATLDDWSRTHLDRLVALEDRWVDAAAGDTLLHLDLRADNLLIRADGTVAFVDWPHARRGAAVLDILGLAPSVGMQGGPDLDWLLARHRGAAAADPDVVLVLLAAIAGLFTDRSLRPPPPGLPTVRAFQAAQGRIARRWLAARLAG
jgi:aminoglycoside phosphotransferase (APT) family kinase protein